MRIFKKKPRPIEVIHSEKAAPQRDEGVMAFASRPPLKIAMIGGGAKSKFFKGRGYDFGWEIWGLNAIRPQERLSDQDPWPRINWARMFNLHRFDHLNRDCPEYIFWDSSWSKANPKVPVYVIDSWHGMLANERLFPLEAIKHRLAPRGGFYHAGSFDMLVAYAIFLGATEIAIHGVTLATDSAVAEPISARACLEYWCGFAEGRGIKVTCTEDSNLFYQYHLVKSNSVYGYDDVRLIEDRTR